MMTTRYALFAGASALIGFQASAIQIAGQNFNGLDDSATFTDLTLPPDTVNGALTNAGSSNSGGPGLDFSSTWTDTLPGDADGGPVVIGNDSSDFIGVNSFAGSNSPDVAPGGAAYASGVEHNFEFNDGDGRIALTFETVDVSAYSDVSVSLNYWARETTWEDDDTILFLVSDGVNSSLTSLSGAQIDAIESDDDGTDNWQFFSIDLLSEGITGSMITLTVAVDNDSGTENIFIDNVSFDGVPEPASAALLGLGGLAMLRRRG